MLFVAGAGLARLSIWSQRQRSRLYTAALLVTALAYTFALPWIGDELVDDVAPDWLGRNVSDVAHTVLVVIASGFLGAVFVRSLSGKTRYQCVWAAFTGLLVVVMVLAYRFSDAARVPVETLFALSDAGTLVHVSGYLVMVLVIVTLAGAVSAMVLREHGFDREPMLLAFAPMPLFGVTYVGVTWWHLVHNPAWFVDHHAQFLAWTAGPAVVLLAAVGMAGLWSVRKR